MSRRWEIFCTVVDNYGDIGVCWRLARQLVAEHGLMVRLWVDDLRALAQLWPTTDASAGRQLLAGVEVCHWREPFADPQPCEADVVVEAFACELPAVRLQAMARQSRPPLWINLEYLSAESWVAGCHGLPSQHPRLPLTKHFFFPGFDAASGGLLRERDLLDRRHALQNDAAAQAQFLDRLGLGDALAARRLSLFAYENDAVAPLLERLAAGDEPWWVLVPAGRVVPDVERWLGEALIGPRRRGTVTVAPLPFLPQDDYDRLLWSCDLNAVRGEDSLVRALWAGRPLLWQIYPQADDAHCDKLDAFGRRYLPALPEWQALLRAWNGIEPFAPAWQWAWPRRQAVAVRTQAWADELAAQPDLATALVRFCANRV
jgi:uncharacterized repeat protein (TIGR03837 family)